MSCRERWLRPRRVSGWRQALAATTLAALSVLPCRTAAALTPTRAVTQYVHEAWSSRDGLPDGAVFAVHQTADGYLWLGTQCCLVRFDGERFVQFASGERGLGQAAFARDLAEDVLGRIWAGFAGGV